jgi:hypothetical protein
LSQINPDQALSTVVSKDLHKAHVL